MGAGSREVLLVLRLLLILWGVPITIIIKTIIIIIPLLTMALITRPILLDIRGIRTSNDKRRSSRRRLLLLLLLCSLLLL